MSHKIDLGCVVGPLAAMLLAAAVDGAGAPTWAQQAMAGIAYVEDVSGHVVAFTQGKPILLNAAFRVGLAIDLP
jgi:hypothetical protein